METMPDSPGDGRADQAPNGRRRRPRAARTVIERRYPERRVKGLTLAERRAARRRALLDAGTELFGTRGYSHTSVEEICRTASVSTRNFYEEFDDKEAVLTELCGEIATAAGEAVLAASSSPDARNGRMVAVTVAALVHTLLDDLRIGRIALIESRAVSEELEQKRREVHQLFVGYLVQYARHSLGVPADDETSRVFALAMIGATNEVMTDWVVGDDKRPLDELVADLTTFFAAQRRVLQR